jgi:hypothetical protein
MDFFPVMRSSEVRVRSSEDLLELGWVVARTTSADGRLLNNDEEVLVGEEAVGMAVGDVGILILRAGPRSSSGFTREIDLMRIPPLMDEEPRCEGLNARD